MRTEEAGARGERGFTLLETALALLIMMIVGLAVVGLFGYAVNYNTGARDRVGAAAAAQRRLEVLRELRFDHASLNAGSATVTETVGGRQYEVTTAIVNTSATLKRITVTVVPTAAGVAWQTQPVVFVTTRASTGGGVYIL